MAFNGITKGLIRAVGLIASRNEKQKTKPSTRYTIEAGGQAIHANRCLTSDERTLLNGLFKSFQEAETPEVKKAILAEIHRQPVTFVPIKRAHLNVKGKTYEGLGKKEMARAAKRATLIQQAA